MQKYIKKVFALFMTVALLFGTVPCTVYAAEALPEPESMVSSEQPAEKLEEPEPASNLETSSAPVKEASPKPSAEPSPSPSLAPEAEEKSVFDTELATVEARQIWPALQKAKTRAAAGVGTAGVLQMGYYCFPEDDPHLVPTLDNKHLGRMPAKSMLYNGSCVAAYCIDQDLGATADQPYTWSNLTKKNQDTIGTILAVGFQWSASDFWHGPSDNGDKWAVTQLLVWEAVKNHIFLQGNGLYGIEAAVDTDFEQIANYAYNPAKFRAYYKEVKKKLNDYMKVPSFANKEPSKAETITLRWDGTKYSATVTDANGILEYFPFQNSLSGVTVVSSGNKLTLSTTTSILSPKLSSKVDSRMAVAGGKGAVAVWHTSDPSQQDFATYNAPGGEPVGCYIKVKTDAVGSAGLVKTSEDGKVEGIQFQITGSDGSSTTKTTDANGNIDIEGLPIYAADGSKITYTATEINVPNKYVKPQSQTFTLTEGQTASIHFENKLKRWRVTVTKSDDRTGSTPQGNGSLTGAKYGVYKGNELVKEYTTDENGQFTTDYYPYGEDWTLREISAGEGYLVSDVSTQLCEIPAGSNDEFNDNTASVTDTVMRGGVSVEKRDSKTGERPQGDADFSGIQFEIVNKSKNPVEVGGKKAAPGEVAVTITTNAQGIATTGPNVLPYGDYLIREKSTNASMLKTFTEEIPVTVSENGKMYTFTAENDVVRGGIAVEKRDSKTGERPQGNADFSGITFEIVNSSRTVTFSEKPEIKTTATVNGEKKAEPKGEVTITDTVSYTGLTPGKTYKLSGVLMDKSTGEKLLVDGKEITAEKEFTPENASGSVEITFTFDASALAGKSVVVFETLYHDNKEIAVHADITDKDQTVEFEEPDKPQIKTKATVDGEKEADPLEKVTLIDTVTYSNLTPGKTYTVQGVLMDKSTGKKLLINGKEVTAETEFTPDKANGSVDLSFTFDASGLAGKSVVAFETLYHENIEVAVHADIDDDDQTVVICQPRLKTTATIGGKKEAVISKELVLEDKVSYTGLTPGKEYTVKGVLMDKSTGKKFLVSGKEITAEAIFTPEESEGEVTVTFKFDGSKITAKTDLVVFETLYRDGKEVATHADINDEGQTVTLNPEKPKTPTPDVPKTGDGRSILLPLILLGGSIAGLLALFLFWFGRKKSSPQTGSEKDQ